MERNFEGRTVLVTGGSRGIGRQIAKRFASEGANVAIIDIDGEALETAKAELEENGWPVFTKVASVTEKEQVEQAVTEVNSHFGSIDILVNNAGVIRDNMLFRMTDDDWLTVMDVHLKGAFFVTRAVQKYMIENNYGRIINIYLFFITAPS